MKKKPDDEIDDALNADLLRGILGELPNSFLSFAARAFSIIPFESSRLTQIRNGFASLPLKGDHFSISPNARSHFIIPYIFHSQDNYRKGISIEAAMDNSRWVPWTML